MGTGIRSNKIGIVYQDKNLLSDFTILENVYLARLAINGNKNKALHEAKYLLENETIDHDQFQEIIDGKTPKTNPAKDKNNPPESSEQTLNKGIRTDRKSDPEPQATS